MALTDLRALARTYVVTPVPGTPGTPASGVKTSEEGGRELVPKPGIQYGEPPITPGTRTLGRSCGEAADGGLLPSNTWLNAEQQVDGDALDPKPPATPAFNLLTYLRDVKHCRVTVEAGQLTIRPAYRCPPAVLAVAMTLRLEMLGLLLVQQAGPQDAQ